MSKNEFQDKMFRELEDKKIFNKAQVHAYNYVDNVWDRNVYPSDEAIFNLSHFEEELPEHSMEAIKVLDFLNLYGSPASVAQTGGRYFGLVNGGALPVGLSIKWLTDFWDQNTPLYTTSPIVSKLEEVTEKWLCDLFGFANGTAAGFVSGSTMAILSGLAAARYKLLSSLGWDVNKQGMNNAPEIKIVAGKHIHGAVLKALATLGFGTQCIQWVNVDDQGSILLESIPDLDDTTILLLQAGNVNSGAFDNFDLICDKANAAGSWVHIDGAFGLWAAGANSLKYLTKGIEKADSWSVDGHKTLNTPYDSGVVLCKHREALASALQATGAYIKYGTNRDGMLYTPEMSRRARVVEMWSIMKYLGRDGIDNLVQGLHDRAVQFSEELTANGFNVLNDVVFNQVLISSETDKQTRTMLETIQELRECWCSGSTWFGQSVIRISVCSWATTSEDVSRSVASFVQARNRLHKI